MNPKIIKTDEDYDRALTKIESLMDASPGSSEEEELELWSLLVEQYEELAFPMDLPDPIAAIRFRMDQLGLRQQDLAEIFSGKNRVSEVLNGKRGLSLTMIRALHSKLGIPAEVLIHETAA